MNNWIKLGIIVAALALISLIGAWSFRGIFVTFIDNYEMAFQYDKFTGKVELLNRTGYFVRNPIRYKVHGIDLRPYQVTISANQRILNAKLVKFKPFDTDKDGKPLPDKPTGLFTFLAWHGRDAGDNTYNMTEILKCYAFDRDDGKDCPFLEVVNQLAPNQAPKQ